MLEAAIDLEKWEGQRNKAIIETLFSCGLRVSELVPLHRAGSSTHQLCVRYKSQPEAQLENASQLAYRIGNAWHDGISPRAPSHSLHAYGAP